MTSTKNSSAVRRARKPITVESSQTTSEIAEALRTRIPFRDVSEQLQLVLGPLSKHKISLRNKSLRQLASHVVMRLRADIERMIVASNVDTSASDVDRATSYLAVVRNAVTELDGSNKDNVVTFLVRTAWHEGAGLTKRVQSGGGPARSFMQMEPGAAKDGVIRAKKKRWLDTLATASGNTEVDLESAAADLSLSAPWPAGNLIEEGLRLYDLFGVEAARAYLSVSADPIPGELNEQADYWEDKWHGLPDAVKKAQWLSNAKKLNKVLGWI